MVDFSKYLKNKPMTKIEERARFVAAAVTRQAQEVGAWNTESESGLIADVMHVQEEAAQERVKPLLPLIEHNAAEVRPCRLCQMKIAMVRTPAGALMPVCLTTGLPHHANCPNVDQFRKKVTA